ncbi:MAG: DUF58 domain-containing protein [Thermoproteus sp.]
MPSARWSPPYIYEATRRAAPLLYFAVAWPHLVPAAASLALLALENTALRKLHTASLFLHLAVISLLPWPWSIALAAAAVPLLHEAKKRDNPLPWYVHVSALIAGTLAVPALAPVLLYSAGEALYYYIKFARDKPAVEAGGRLKTVADTPLTYKLKIRSGAPAVVELPDGRLVQVSGEASVDVKVKFDVAGVYAPQLVFTYVSPTKTVKLKRRVRHPPILVYPRARAAVEAGRRALAGFLEQVTGAKEYAPGDPLRLLHWKKMAKILRPVVKQLEDRARSGLRIAAVLYATSPKTSDRVLEALASAVAAALTKTERVEVQYITRRGAGSLSVDRQSYAEAMEELISMAEALNVEAREARDYAGILPRQAPPQADVIIGERALAAPLCIQNASCVLV